MALFLTFATGLFILLGSFIVILTKNNHKIINFSISMAFGVMFMLIFLELIPEATEMMQNSFNDGLHYPIMLGFVILGILLLKILDLFVPDHEHKTSDCMKHDSLEHIGMVASVALSLHNIIEGMAIYSTVTTDASMGILVMLGVGLHNIPMGMVITSTLYQGYQDRKKTIFMVLLIAISTFFGGLLMACMSHLITDLVLGILLSITLGMLLYIIVFELLKEMIHSHHKKISTIGIIFGILIFLLTRFFE